MSFQYLYDVSNQILEALQKFATIGLSWFTTEMTFGVLPDPVTPLEVLSTFFFTFLVARIVLNMLD